MIKQFRVTLADGTAKIFIYSTIEECANEVVKFQGEECRVLLNEYKTGAVIVFSSKEPIRIDEI